MISRVRAVRAGLAALFFAGSAAAADTPSSPFTAWAIGLPNGYIVMGHQARVVHVTAEDAARGPRAASPSETLVPPAATVTWC